MADFTLKGNPFHTVGDLPAAGTPAPDFALVKTDLSTATLADFAGRNLVLNIFPSLDTDVCAASVRRFNQEAAELENTTVLCVSMDLPFAHRRFCTTEGLDNVVSGSDFRDGAFGASYGMRIVDGPLQGLLARSVVVVGPDGAVKYSQQVPETVEEPDYGAALSAI